MKKIKTFCIVLILMIMSMLQVGCLHEDTAKGEKEESVRHIPDPEINKDTLKVK